MELHIMASFVEIREFHLHFHTGIKKAGDQMAACR